MVTRVAGGSVNCFTLDGDSFVLEEEAVKVLEATFGGNELFSMFDHVMNFHHGEEIDAKAGQLVCRPKEDPMIAYSDCLEAMKANSYKDSSYRLVDDQGTFYYAYCSRPHNRDVVTQIQPKVETST